MRLRLTRNFRIAAVAMVVAISVTTYPLCGALFGCGCTLSHGASHCNVHHATGPHCPWCAGPGLAVAANFAAILGGTGAAIALAQRWFGGTIWVGLLGGAIGYLGVASVAGLVTARAIGYPVWWGIRV